MLYFCTAKVENIAIDMMYKIEYLILLVSEFAKSCGISEVASYQYLQQYGAFALCDKHYNIMHTLSVEDNITSLHEFCRRKGGQL